MFQPSERIALAALDRSAASSQWLRVVAGLHAKSGFWWLDSALPDGRLGRHSFAGADPYLWLSARGGEVELDVRREVRPGLRRGFHRFEADPIDCARSLLPRTDSLIYSIQTSVRTSPPLSTTTPSADGNPRWHEAAGLSAGLALPFLGGAVGYFSYELARSIEGRLRFENVDDLGLPDLSLGFVDRVLAYDHASERLWLIGLGFGDGRAPGEDAPRALAITRSQSIVDDLSVQIESLLSEPDASDSQAVDVNPADTTRAGPSAKTRSSASFARPLVSTSDASGYAKSVDTILQEIGDGNVYQANFSQRLTIDAPIDPWHLYGALRRHNPAPFGGYLSTPEAAILSSSPERFLRLDDSRHIESRPIKGTRPRGDDVVEDARLAADLAASEKDRAENLMIVDLVRNDLGRVCAPGSIEVPELMQIEAYAAVFQMVSTVTGTLATGRDAFDLLRAMFPPGSMTGAPKLAAIALLERLESVRRGVYAGALGYLDLRGGLDLSVVIRTIVWQEGRAHLHVGGGVVADSSPEAEYVESLDKARAPLQALEDALRRADS
jgi:para-aminobenzoate synthetase component 1